MVIRLRFPYGNAGYINSITNGRYYRGITCELSRQTKKPIIGFLSSVFWRERNSITCAALVAYSPKPAILAGRIYNALAGKRILEDKILLSSGNFAVLQKFSVRLCLKRMREEIYEADKKCFHTFWEKIIGENLSCKLARDNANFCFATANSLCLSQAI